MRNKRNGGGLMMFEGVVVPSKFKKSDENDKIVMKKSIEK